MIRVAIAAALAAAAVAAALLAADVGSVRSALERGDRAYASTPSRATWSGDTRLGGAATSLLATNDDLQLRHGLQAYVDAGKLRLRLDNALGVESARARAQDLLEPVARNDDPRAASQALTLLGILAFRSSASGNARSQVEAAVSDFTDAVRLDPSNRAAAFDLELLLRMTAAKGSRVESGQGGGFGRGGRHGATGGRSGSGY